jgi:xanthine dehydrogenase accessory factor
MTDWIGTLKSQWMARRAAIVVSIVAAKGSVPRPPGTRMIVTAETIAGTIGGGHLEHRAIEVARDLIVAGGPLALHRFALGASLGQCCGGLVQLLFEPVYAAAEWLEAVDRCRSERMDCAIVVPVRGDSLVNRMVVTASSTTGTLGSPRHDAEAVGLARSRLGSGDGSGLARLDGADGPEVFVDILRVPDFSIVLFGAGHVGRALVRTLAEVDCRIQWIDTREDAFPAVVPDHVACLITDTPEAEVAAAPAGAYFLVMTHNHALDETLAAHILAREDFAYFGMIGSVSKRRQFEKRLEARGTPHARLAAMTCPIGIEGIAGKEPEVIAIAVAAEMLRVRSCAMAALARSGRRLQATR